MTLNKKPSLIHRCCNSLIKFLYCLWKAGIYSREFFYLKYLRFFLVATESLRKHQIVDHDTRSTLRWGHYVTSFSRYMITKFTSMYLDSSSALGFEFQGKIDHEFVMVSIYPYSQFFVVFKSLMEIVL